MKQGLPKSSASPLHAKATPRSNREIASLRDASQSSEFLRPAQDRLLDSLCSLRIASSLRHGSFGLSTTFDKPSLMKPAIFSLTDLSVYDILPATVNQTGNP